MLCPVISEHLPTHSWLHPGSGSHRTELLLAGAMAKASGSSRACTSSPDTTAPAVQGRGDGLRAPARSKLLGRQLKSAPTDGNLADKLRKGWIESSAFFLSDFNWEAYVLINPRARLPPSASRGAKMLQRDTQGHHHCWGHIFFQIHPPAAPCALPDGCHGPWCCLDRGDSAAPTLPPTGTREGIRVPPGWAWTLHWVGQAAWTLLLQTWTSHQLWPGPCPCSVPVPCPPQPRSSPPTDIGATSPQREGGRGPSGAAAPCALWSATCHKLRTPGSINLPGNKNQGK